VLEAFQTHRLVGLGEVHDLQNHGDAVALLLSDLRLAGVEFGNALDTIDAFIGGQPVNDADLRPVWCNTTSSPTETWDGAGPLSTQGAVFAGIFVLLALTCWLHARLLGRAMPPRAAGIPAPVTGRPRAAQPGGAPVVLTRLAPYVTVVLGRVRAACRRAVPPDDHGVDSGRADDPAPEDSRPAADPAR